MTATNHALTGATIGLLVGIPVIAIPASVLSHFICDALPHFGARDKEGSLKKKWFKNYLIVEASICFLIVLVIAIVQPTHWQLAALCAFLAASPDFLWIRKYRAVKNNKKWRPNLFDKFASNIQWFQRPIGAWVEAAWFFAAISILIPILSLAKK